MPAKKSAIKDLKQSKKKHARNLVNKKALKKSVKSMDAVLKESDIVTMAEEIKKFSSAVDKAVDNKLIHKNKASRKKSRYMKKINSLAAAAKNPAEKVEKTAKATKTTKTTKTAKKAKKAK